MAVGWGQAIESGIGEAGEQAGQGINQAIIEAQRIKQQQDTQANTLTQLDQAQQRINLEKLGQQQTYGLAKSQQDLYRENIMRQGWNHAGTVKDGNGQYYQVYDNPNMPPGQQTTRIPYNGIPPDSMEAQIANFHDLQDQGFEPEKAMQIAFKQAGLYRNSPAEQLGEWQKAAQSLFEDKGVKSVPVFGYGNIDISTPEGQAKYAQAMADSGSRGAAAYIRATMGNGAGVGKSNVNMTGWTPNEQREFKSLEAEVLKQESAFSNIYDRALSNSFDPVADAEKIAKLYQEKVGPYQAQLEAKRAEIDARHGRGGNVNPPSPGQTWSKTAWAAANPGKDANLAEKQARAQHAIIVP